MEHSSNFDFQPGSGYRLVHEKKGKKDIWRYERDSLFTNAPSFLKDALVSLVVLLLLVLVFFLFDSISASNAPRSAPANTFPSGIVH